MQQMRATLLRKLAEAEAAETEAAAAEAAAAEAAEESESSKEGFMAEVNETVPATVSPAVAKATEAGSVLSSPAAVEKAAEAEAVPDSPPPTVERPVAHVEEAISPATVSKVAAAAEKVSLNEESRAQEHDAPLACPCPNSNPAPIPRAGDTPPNASPYTARGVVNDSQPHR
jgi:hypothetical protein